MTDASTCHETVDPDTRDEMLVEYKYRCQGCGRHGPQKGGSATLHVHHQTRDPDGGVGVHDKENLTLFCKSCHSWLHQQTSEDEVPIDLTDEDLAVLLPQDIEILRILGDAGPLATGDITAALSVDLTVTTVRERLWVLMGLDTLVEPRDRHVVDQDADSGEWGLVGQIEHSARGRIPTDPQVLLQRIEDEFVRRALDNGCDRDAVMDVLDLSRRGTFYKEKRARAYAFPLDAVDRRGGRPPADEAVDEQADSAVDDDSHKAGDQQQRLDAVADGAGEEGAETDAGDDPAASENENGRELDSDQSVEPGTENAREHVQKAIEALQALNAAL